jgi:hypothetical protein
VLLNNEWIKKIWYIHSEVLFSLEEERNPVICSKIDGTGGHHVK